MNTWSLTLHDLSHGERHDRLEHFRVYMWKIERNELVIWGIDHQHRKVRTKIKLPDTYSIAVERIAKA